MASASDPQFSFAWWHAMSNWGGNNQYDAYINATDNATQIRLWVGNNKSISKTIGAQNAFSAHPSFNYRIDTFDAKPNIEVTCSPIYDTSKGANTIVLGTKCVVDKFKPMYDDDGNSTPLPMKIWVWANREDGTATDLRLDVVEIDNPTVTDGYVDYTSTSEYAVPTYVYNSSSKELVANTDYNCYRVQIDYTMKNGYVNQFGPFYVIHTPELPSVSSVTISDEGKSGYSTADHYKAVSWKYNGTHFVNVAWGNTLAISRDDSVDLPILKDVYQYTPGMKFTNGVGDPNGSTTYTNVYDMLAADGHDTTYDKYFHVFDYKSGKTLKGISDKETFNCFISSDTKQGTSDENWGKYCYAPSSESDAKSATLLYTLDSYLALNYYNPEPHAATDTNPGWDGNAYCTVPSKAEILAEMASDDAETVAKWTYSELSTGISDKGQAEATIPDATWIKPVEVVTLSSYDDFSTLAETSDATSSSSNADGSGRPDATTQYTLQSTNVYLSSFITNKNCASAVASVTDFPTGVDNVIADDDANVEIYGTDGAIVVNGAKSYNVYAPSGALLYNGNAGSVEMPTGVYIVATSNGKNVKVQVK